MQSYTYFLIDIGCIIVPLIASFYPKHAFYKQWKAFFLANIVVGLFFLVWDAYFTLNGIWGFNPDYLTGLYILNLPIEEMLFFICIPYACVFTFFALEYLLKKNPLKPYHEFITLALVFLLLVIGFMSFYKWYTSVTFLMTAAYLFFRWMRKKDLSYHYLAYFLILPFFFLSNGILTGSFLEETIVWYNDNENLGIRMFTIPVEDTIYGMLLVFMNIDLYLYFRKRFLAN